MKPVAFGQPLSMEQHAERVAKGIELRRRGRTWQSIANELGWESYQAAERACMAHLRKRAKVSTKNHAAFRELEVQRLTAAIEKLTDIVETDHPVLHQGEDTGFVDDGVKIRAIEALGRMSARLCSLLGLDAPTKVEESSTVRFEVVGIDPEALR